MRRLAFLLVLGLAAVVAAGQRPLRIGTVNVVKVFDELDEKVDMNAKLRELEDKRAAQLRQLAEKIRNLEEKAKLLKPDSEEARKTARLLEDAKREFRSQRDATEDHMYNKLFDFTLAIYKKIRQEIEIYAREAGYDIVLRTRDADLGNIDPNIRPRTRYLELNRRIEATTVLYHAPSTDFTEEIIKRLNQKYAAAKAEERKPTIPATQEK